VEQSASAATLDIRRLKEGDLTAAAAICAEAMRDNPLHKRVFGSQPAIRAKRLQRFFLPLLGYVARRGRVYGAFIDQQIVGVFGALAPSHCQPNLADLARLLPRLLLTNTPLGLWRMAIWLGTWARLDPKEPHWHLGPLAVAPAWQRHGIGTSLLSYFFQQETDFPHYLETDKEENVRFYQKFGFQTCTQLNLLQTRSWMMCARPQSLT